MYEYINVTGTDQMLGNELLIDGHFGTWDYARVLRRASDRRGLAFRPSRGGKGLNGLSRMEYS